MSDHVGTEDVRHATSSSGWGERGGYLRLYIFKELYPPQESKVDLRAVYFSPPIESSLF